MNINILLVISMKAVLAILASLVTHELAPSVTHGLPGGGGVFLVDFLSYTTTLIIPETPTRIHVRKSYIENNWELDNICNNLYSWNIFHR